MQEAGACAWELGPGQSRLSPLSSLGTGTSCAPTPAAEKGEDHTPSAREETEGQRE